MSITQTSVSFPSAVRTKRASPSPEQLLSIGDLAREFGVTLRTLRFYEDKGLLVPLRDGNARLYRVSDRSKLSLILKGKKLGFTLSEIRDLIGGKSGSGDVASLSLKPDQIVSQIEHLKRPRDEIDDAIAQLRAAHARLSPTG